MKFSRFKQFLFSLFHNCVDKCLFLFCVCQLIRCFSNWFCIFFLRFCLIDNDSQIVKNHWACTSKSTNDVIKCFFHTSSHRLSFYTCNLHKCRHIIRWFHNIQWKCCVRRRHQFCIWNSSLWSFSHCFQHFITCNSSRFWKSFKWSLQRLIFHCGVNEWFSQCNNCSSDCCCCDSDCFQRFFRWFRKLNNISFHRINRFSKFVDFFCCFVVRCDNKIQ